MIVGARPLPAYYLLYERDLSPVYADIQVRWFGVVLPPGRRSSPAVARLTPVRLARPDGAARDLPGRLRGHPHGLLHRLEHRPAVVGAAGAVLTGAMGLGGADGSTASGVEIVRAISVLRELRRVIRKPFPDETFPESLDESGNGEYASANFRKASARILLWLLLYLAGAGLLLLALPTGVPPDSGVLLGTVPFTVASAQGNVGLVNEIVTPATPTLPAGAKLALTPWIGRLEVIPGLVLFRTLVLVGG